MIYIYSLCTYNHGVLDHAWYNWLICNTKRKLINARAPRTPRARACTKEVHVITVCFKLRRNVHFNVVITRTLILLHVLTIKYYE